MDEIEIGKDQKFRDNILLSAFVGFLLTLATGNIIVGIVAGVLFWLPFWLLSE